MIDHRKASGAIAPRILKSLSRVVVMPSGVVVCVTPHRCPACGRTVCVWRNAFGTSVCFDCSVRAVGA